MPQRVDCFMVKIAHFRKVNEHRCLGAIWRIVRDQRPVSKISGNQIIRTLAAADVHPGSGRTYQIAVDVEGVQKTRLIEAGIGLNSPQRLFGYKK